MQGRNEGSKRGATPRAPNHYWGDKSLQGTPKSPNDVTSTFFDTAHFFRKTSGSNMGAPNLGYLLLPAAILPRYTPVHKTRNSCNIKLF